MWVYLLGERTAGSRVKIGKTSEPYVARRISGVNSAQFSGDEYVLLAAVRGTGTCETALKDYFKDARLDLGPRTEYFEATDALVEYVLWLRQLHCVSLSDCDAEADIPEEHPAFWLPDPDRRVRRPMPDPLKLVQDYEQLQGPLRGTAWSWMPDPLSSFQDYFTPPDLVKRAAIAMNGIDLDAASHFLANRYFRQADCPIGDYFTVNRSAFEHVWHGNVWLNPPYGNWAPWFDRAAEMFDQGCIAQLCMLSPIYAFSTIIAQRMMARASAIVILSPTPEFYNPADKKKTGTNLPHAIAYWGSQPGEFLCAYRDVGIPCWLADPRG